ncbi:Translation initiation factor IF-2 [Chlorella vulgaris]
MQRALASLVPTAASAVGVAGPERRCLRSGEARQAIASGIHWLHEATGSRGFAAVPEPAQQPADEPQQSQPAAAPAGGGGSGRPRPRFLLEKLGLVEPQARPQQQQQQQVQQQQGQHWSPARRDGTSTRQQPPPGARPVGEAWRPRQPGQPQQRQQQPRGPQDRRSPLGASATATAGQPRRQDGAVPHPAQQAQRQQQQRPPYQRQPQERVVFQNSFLGGLPTQFPTAFPRGGSTPTPGSDRKQHKAEQKARKAAETVARNNAQPVLPEEVLIPEDVTLVRLAQLLGVDVVRLEQVLGDLGEAVESRQDLVPPDAAELAALELGKVAVLDMSARRGAPLDADAVPRPAVVTVMGHVDHGKTTLLDALRQTSVAAGEAGGITQHIGAFEVQMPGSQQSLTFLDTPGHAAFSAMRARGAAVTDLVVLVVAADDGVMPQTREAISHSRAAGCPIVVAITKCDAPTADPAGVRRQLLAAGLETEEVGGSIQVVEVAAVTGQGLGELEEALLLQAEVMELGASRSRRAEAVVIEAKVDRGQGPVATVVVKRGTLRVGQPMVVGTEWGRVRSLRGTGGRPVEEVLPGQPAEISGLKGLPQAGDLLLVMDSEERAQLISKARTSNSEVRRRSDIARQLADQRQQAELAAEGADGAEGGEGQHRTLCVIIKADVQGSAEAVREAVAHMSTEHVKVQVVHVGVGPVSQSDVQLAVPLGAKVLGFNVRTAAPDVDALAKMHGVEVRCQRVIYGLLEDVGSLLKGASPQTEHEVVAGTAEVLAVFPLKGKRGKDAGVVAGCRVSDGSIKGSLKYRVLRGGEVVHTGRCSSLKRHKLEVETVGKGTECGVLLDGFDGVQPGDQLQCIRVEMRSDEHVNAGPANNSLFHFTHQDAAAVSGQPMSTTGGARLRQTGSLVTSISHQSTLATQKSQDESEDTGTERKPSLPSTPVELTRSQDDDPEELEKAYRVFDWKAYNEPFDVPWGAKETVFGMVAWCAGFLGVGLAFIPVAAALAGPAGFSALTASGKSGFALANQVAETGVSLAIIRLGVAKFEPLPPGLFKYDFSAPFKRPRGWLMWGLLGIVLSPLVVYAAATLSDGLGVSDAGGRGTVDSVSSIITMDFSTYASLMATTAVLAPLLEETVFRGFLLTSLTKWMPVPAAVAVSSVAFGMVHLTPRDFPQLTALGFLLGFSYVRSRNLLTPMLIHGAWNGTVLTILFFLASQGLDIDARTGQAAQVFEGKSGTIVKLKVAAGTQNFQPLSMRLSPASSCSSVTIKAPAAKGRKCRSGLKKSSQATWPMNGIARPPAVMQEPADDALQLPLLSGPSDGATACPRGASVPQTCAIVLNIFVGLGLLSMPFAVMKGGWVALIALGLLVPLFAASGQLICLSFEMMPGGMPRTYANLGAAAAGSAGRNAVLLFSCCELFGATLVTLMICWQMLELLLPSEGIGPLHPNQLAALLSCAVLLPLLFIDLRRLSRFSLLGSLSTAGVVCLVLALLAIDPQRSAMPQQPPPPRHVASLGLVQSLGIFALSCSAHTTLPALRSAMAKPSRFPAALAASFGIMAACYGTVAAAGYWYWGDSSSPLVTTDLAVNSAYTFSRVPVDRLLAVFVLVSALTKYPALNMDMILSATPVRRDSLGNARAPLPWVERALRLTLFAAAVLLALTVYSSLGSVLSLVGGLCSLTCSLLLPTAFYTLLAWERLSWPSRLSLSALVVLSVSLIALTTASSLAELTSSDRSAPAPAAAAPTSSSSLDVDLKVADPIVRLLAMSSRAVLLGLVLAAAATSAGAEKAWSEWYWSPFDADSATATTIHRGDDFAIARNMFHVQRFFAVLDAADSAEGNVRHIDDTNSEGGAPSGDSAAVATEIAFSQNIAVAKLPFANTSAHLHNIKAGMLRGTCLWIDFPFPAFPENMGHWLEALAPVYSCLSNGSWMQAAPEAQGGLGAVIFPNLRREQVEGLSWVMDMLRLTLQPGLEEGAALPRMLFFNELEALNATSWLGFERVLLVHNRYTLPSGRSGFTTPQHAEAFRRAAYAAANVSWGGPAWEARVAPPVITYLMAMNHEPVVNNGEVLTALREVGRFLGLAVRPYSVTPGASFPSFVASMARTGVLVARHGPLLANALFLPPGAVVLELLPYNWEWRGISEIYLNLTRSVGSVHHFAWKANSSEWVMYLEAEDAKYSHWNAEECSSRYCLEAHARAGMVVDTGAVKDLLRDLLPLAFKGGAVEQLASRRPWPSTSNVTGGTGLWWDV